MHNQVFKCPWVMSLHASITHDECYIRKDLHASNSLSVCLQAHQVCSSKHTQVQQKIHTCVCNVTSEQYCTCMHESFICVICDLSRVYNICNCICKNRPCEYKTIADSTAEFNGLSSAVYGNGILHSEQKIYQQHNSV